ncbi:HXXXD-type acyl-transferase family protein [Actinidia rufa]|uniref:HXXXD-type acyl-transferase family protein n=1 Tax=Actinidia rufa TaxID=165716 RepID=A0A7J0DJ14_9ERIC|nr:HXXXD-type acyl-transferase family protein [Actinidia rufa]
MGGGDHEGEQKPSSLRHSRFNKGKRNGDKPKLSCFLCDGNQFARDCPQRAKLAALIQDDEEEPRQEEAKVGSLRLLNAIKAKVGKAKASRKGHMYVEAKVLDFNTRALIDTGTSHNFIEVKEAKRLGLQLKEEQGWIKAVNTEARPIYGVARNVRLHIGDWCGQVDFTVAFPIPFAETICLMGEGSACMVPLARETLSKSKTLSAMQLSKEKTSAKIPAAILTKSSGLSSQLREWHADMAKAAKRMKKKWRARTGKRSLPIPSKRFKGQGNKDNPWGRDNSCHGCSRRATNTPKESPYDHSGTRSAKATKCRMGRGHSNSKPVTHGRLDKEKALWDVLN